MAIPLTVNGQVFEYPQNFDEGWGIDATGWAIAVTAGMLSLSGGNFPLTAQVNFGPSFGIKVQSIVTQTVLPSTVGFIALSKTDTIGFRNNANTGNLLLGIDGSNNLTFNGSPLGLTALTNTHIYVGNVSNVPTDVAVSGDATMANTGALTISNGAITNAKIASGAAIAVNKLAALTASRAIVTDGSGLLSPSTVTATELGYLSGVTSPIQTQLGTYLPLSGGTMSGAISMASHKITALTQGTAAGDAISFPIGTPQITQGAVTVPSSVQSDTIGGVSGTNITSKTITTSGFPVVIIASATLLISSSSGTSDFTAGILRGSAVISGASIRSYLHIFPTTDHDAAMPFSVAFIDTPAAGTYIYNLNYSLATGTVSSIIQSSIVLIELKA